MSPFVVAGPPLAACCVAVGARSAREAGVADRLAIGRSSTSSAARAAARRRPVVRCRRAPWLGRREGRRRRARHRVRGRRACGAGAPGADHLADRDRGAVRRRGRRARGGGAIGCVADAGDPVCRERGRTTGARGARAAGGRSRYRDRVGPTRSDRGPRATRPPRSSSSSARSSSTGAAEVTCPSCSIRWRPRSGTASASRAKCDP